MKAKKLAAAVMAGLMVATAVPMAAAVTSDMASVAYAAKGGAKLGGGAKSAPKAESPKAAEPAAGTSKSVSGNGESYKPSKDAKSLEKNAPASNAAAAKSNTAANTAQSGSRWGNVMRNIGLLAGGMMLGHLLSSMFGMGGGMLGDILGLVFNVLMVVVAFMVLRWLWQRFRGRKNEEQNVYRSNLRDSNMGQPEMKNITPQARQITDIKGPEDGYDAKRTADTYRNR